MRSVVSLCLLLAVPAAAQQVQAPAQSTPYQRAIAAGYKALTLCSAIFNAGRTQAQVEALELRGIYPEYAAIVPALSVDVDDLLRTVEITWSEDMPARLAIWRAGTGCAVQPIGTVNSEPSAVASALADGASVNFPRPLRLRPDPQPWPMGDRGIAPRPSRATAAVVERAFDQATYGTGSETVGVVVLRDGKVVAERYRDGFGPFTSNRTWSVAKSIAGTLVGMALSEAGVPVTGATTNWNMMDDPRRAITYDHLLRMASGLHSDTAGNRTDAIYFGGTTVPEQALGWPLEAKPGTRFRYANNDTLLAVHSLSNLLGDRYSGYPRQALLNPLGMRNTVAETDWAGNYILSSQVWSTARDLARLGQFWLQDGVWAGKRLLPQGWVKYMTTSSGPQPASGPGYGATLWLFGPEQGLPECSYAAQGNRGQYVMVIPSERLVVVRRGEDPGPARFDIAKFTADIIAAK